MLVAGVRALGIGIDPDPMGEASHRLHGDGWGWLSELGGRSSSHAATDGPPHGLTDVPAWIDDAVRWITANRHATGYPDNTYRPNNNITRASVTHMLYRIQAEVVDPLSPVERSALLALLSTVPATADDAVPEWLVNWKAHDLVTLLLSLPGFQRR